MTFLGRIAMFFPALHLVLSGAAIIWAIDELAVIPLALFIIYLLPPLLFRLYTMKYPLHSGIWFLNQPLRSDWWIAHQLQLLYAALPALEAVLRVIPGVYSAWLRLWGARIGKRVHWTPSVDIIDRHMIEVGDDVVFGHRVTCSSHIITKKKNGNIVLIVRGVKVGKGVMIGAGARIGPGVIIPDHTIVPYSAEYKLRYAT